MFNQIAKPAMFLGLVMMLTPASLTARGNFGLGFVLGDPTAFSAKLWTSSRTAIDMAVGWAGYWRRDGYYDPDCYNSAFYNRNQRYCNERPNNYRGSYPSRWNIFHMHADYLFHNRELIRSTEKFSLFYGPGLALEYFDYEFPDFAVRGNFGITWDPRRMPFEVFFELAPLMRLFPGPDFDMNGGLGMRFYF